MFWLRPGLADTLQGLGWLANLPVGRCAALFDVDGVLIDVSSSFRRSVAAATATLVRVSLGDAASAALADAPTPLVTADDIHHFKLAGGFNSDWDLVLALTALWVARLREWRGQPQAAITLAELAEQARVAAEAGRGGVAWVRAVVPPSAIPSRHDARWVHEEYYLGAQGVRTVYGHTPRFAPDAPGFAHAEEPLLDTTLLPTLIRQGITRFGIITGRDGPEVEAALRLLTSATGLRDDALGDELNDALDDAPDDRADEALSGVADGAQSARNQPGKPAASVVLWADSTYGRSPFAVIVPSSLYRKPDPRGLAHAIQALDAGAAFFIGDTGDDLGLVLRYRDELQRADPTLPQTLAVMVAEGATVATYQTRGADIILEHVRELPAALAALAQGAAPTPSPSPATAGEGSLARPQVARQRKRAAAGQRAKAPSPAAAGLGVGG